MPFPVYKDLEKPVADIFNDDFDTKYTLKVKSPGPAGLAITTNTTLDVSKETKLSTKVSAKWPHKSGFTLEKFEVANNGAITTETSLTGSVPGLKLEFKGNDSNKGDLSATYTHNHFTATTELDVLNLSKGSVSITSGQGPVSVGLATDASLSKPSVTALSATIGYSLPSVFQAYIKSTKFFAEHTAFVSYNVNKEVTVAGQAIYKASAWQFLLAGVYRCNPETTLKFKASTNAGLSASVKQNFDKKLSIVGSAEVPKSLDNVKFGVAASLG